MINKLLTALLLLHLTFSADAQQAFSREHEDSLLTILERNNKSMGSIAVMEKGKILYSRAIGFATDEPQRINADTRTLFRIGSITKMFTSVMIFQLIEENKLQLTTTLDRFFPAIKNSGSITIGDMLNHRSGIHSFTSEIAYMTYMTKPKTRKELLDIISSFNSDFEPGSKYEYSNSNYVLLGYIIEDLRKDTYPNALQRFICDKAGLSETHYGGKADPSAHGSHSFRFTVGWDRMPETDMSIPHGAGAIVSTPSDLVKFISALFDGRLISKASLDKMMVIKDGMGYGIQKFTYETRSLYGHGGGIDGFSSILVYIPDEKLAVSYCSNGTVFPVFEILTRTLGNYYGSREKLPEFKAYAISLSELEKYAGTYTDEKQFKLRISVNNGRLMGQGSGQPPFPLEPTARDEFRFDIAGIVLKFHPADNHLDLIQGGKTTTFTRSGNN